MNYWLDLPAFIPKLPFKLKHTRSNKTLHKITEIRTSEYPICTPKMAPPVKEHWWSQEEYWLVHVRSRGKADMWRVGGKGSD